MYKLISSWFYYKASWSPERNSAISLGYFSTPNDTRKYLSRLHYSIFWWKWCYAYWQLVNTKCTCLWQSILLASVNFMVPRRRRSNPKSSIMTRFGQNGQPNHALSPQIQILSPVFFLPSCQAIESNFRTYISSQDVYARHHWHTPKHGTTLLGIIAVGNVTSFSVRLGN